VFARLIKLLLSLPFLIAAAVFGFYLLFGFVLVDPLAKKILPWIGEEKLASRLSVEKVEFNPLTLELTVQGLKLAEKSGKPLAGFDRLYLDLESSGLFRFAWRIRDVTLSAPRANVEVRPGGTLNWAALIDKLNEDKEPPKDTMPRVLIERIKIEKGDIHYADANRGGEPFRVSLTPLGIELDGLSTLPEDRGHYLLAAKLPEQGGTLKWKGDVSLNPVTSDGEVALEGVSLPNLLRVIKTPRNFELPSGKLAAGLRYRFALVKDTRGPEPSGKPRPDQPWLQVNGANLIVHDLALVPRGGGVPVLELAEARVSDANFDLARREIGVAGVSLAGGKFVATRDVKGVVDWQTLFLVEEGAAGGRPKAPKPAGAEAAAPITPWKIGVREIRMADWVGHFTDQGFVKPLSAGVEGFGLTAALTAEVGASTIIDVGPVNAALGPVRVLSGSQPVAELQHAALVNGGMTLAENRLDIEAVELNGARTTVTLDKKNNFNWADILQKAPGVPAAAPERLVTKAVAPLDVQLARLSLDGLEVDIVDQSPPKPVRVHVAEGFVTLKDLSLDLDKAVPLEAGFTLRQGGRLDARGTVVPGKASGRLDLRLAGLSLKPFAAYVNQFARLNLHSGTASTRGKLAFEQAKSGMKLEYDGGFSVNNLAITEEDTDAAFLGWERLQCDSLELRLKPDRLHMNELLAHKAFGKVIIFEDKTLNLKRILRGNEAAAPAAPAAAGANDKAEGDAEATATASPPAKAKSAEGGAPADFPLTIERLRIEDANAEFADLSLTPQFGTRMHSLSGVITGLSTAPATMAQVELDGKVDDYGSARVRGSIQPFRATDFTDLKLTFRNLEMVNLTPYSGKFAGRKIESGRLSVDLEYKIKNRQLAGENKFVVNRLKLGERVDSPDAMKLPFDLAIALLEDSNGVIDLDLPVSGSLDDPKFSYGKIIWKAIVNVLTKLVTAPFRALGKLLGANAEKFEAVGFDPGSSALLPPEQEKLRTLVDALAKRPALTLTVEPGFDPKADRRALQEQAMRRDAAAVTGVKLAAGEAPDPVDVNHYKVQTWLEDRYMASAGKEDYQKLRASFRQDAGVATRVLESQMVERLARQFKTRDQGPASVFHTELLERLTRRVKVEDAALTKLAEARGAAMRDELLKLGLEPTRVSVGAPSPQTLKDQLVGSKMNLAAGKHAVAEPPHATPAGTTGP
jgi:uncharacterized protein involved in outer membrane biogenesis